MTKQKVKKIKKVWAVAKVSWFMGNVIDKDLLDGYEPFQATENFLFLKKLVPNPKKIK